ncbi:Glycosyltransferase involved in cell wall bisynthesis [Roseivivax halotolerans]|uniref:Glycosyltransferase involved in cell wall bisynthesis n=1 Tax=Roseivivax halotolerans TaxID=93684 RepID=A0A1I6A2D5_9RHOB|nr:glycosyltransferase [Roseivivax halotolerans]SFQ62869.1 Glycosyltransferase involved in cell wall bisynthesis [Roseivivax halotolerans]
MTVPGQRISILLPDLRGGGAERISIVLAHEFARAGHQVEFVLRQARGELLDEARQSFSVVDLDTARVRSVLRKLVTYLRQRQPDVLLAAMWPLTCIAPVASRLAGLRCKVLVSEHGILSAQYKDWGAAHRIALRATTGLGYRLAHRRIGVSDGVARDMAGLSSMAPDRFDTIYNPVPPRAEPSEAAIAAAEALWNAPPGQRLVTVGTMKAVKNHPLLLRAFAQLPRPGARLMFVGDGSERDALVSLAQELGVADRVIFAGFHPDPSPFYRTADLFALSSNYEGFGNVIVEALSCGTPVVSTDCPSGPNEILEGGRYGRLVPVGDEQALAQAMSDALAAPVDRDALIQRAADFAPAIAAQGYLALLDLT